jgi:hypothetical protein
MPGVRIPQSVEAREEGIWKVCQGQWWAPNGDTTQAATCGQHLWSANNPCAPTHHQGWPCIYVRGIKYPDRSPTLAGVAILAKYKGQEPSKKRKGEPKQEAASTNTHPTAESSSLSTFSDHNKYLERFSIKRPIETATRVRQFSGVPHG